MMENWKQFPGTNVQYFTVNIALQNQWQNFQIKSKVLCFFRQLFRNDNSHRYAGFAWWLGSDGSKHKDVQKVAIPNKFTLFYLITIRQVVTNLIPIINCCFTSHFKGSCHIIWKQFVLCFARSQTMHTMSVEITDKIMHTLINLW